MRPALVDVSRYQGEIDAQSIKDEGFVGIVARATIGIGYGGVPGSVDPQFIRSETEARNKGLIFGAYHVLWPSNQNPELEAETFWAAVAPDLYVLDVELTHGLSKSNVFEQARRFCIRLRELTDAPIVVYTGSWFWTFRAGWEDQFPLWEAEYTVTHPIGGVDKTQQPNGGGPTFVGWSDWKIWQWTSSGNPLGAQSQSMDYNVFNGTEAELREWLRIEEEDPNPCIELWELATMTLREIVDRITGVE